MGWRLSKAFYVTNFMCHSVTFQAAFGGSAVSELLKFHFPTISNSVKIEDIRSRPVTHGLHCARPGWPLPEAVPGGRPVYRAPAGLPGRVG